MFEIMFEIIEMTLYVVGVSFLLWAALDWIEWRHHARLETLDKQIKLHKAMHGMPDSDSPPPGANTNGVGGRCTGGHDAP
jgi:hypothetical protein